jgi:hypothetical protein
MLVYILIIFAALMRLVPHIPDVTPLTGLALFAGVYLKRSQAMWVPLAALACSDLFLPSEPLTTRLSVYGSFALIGLIGWWLQRGKSAATILLASLGGSVLFYLVTNFAFLYPTSMYAHNWSGIIASYYNALPFFRDALIGDLIYTGFLFGAYAFAQRSAPQLVAEKEHQLK